jgi:hypothetical protein
MKLLAKLKLPLAKHRYGIYYVNGTIAIDRDKLKDMYFEWTQVQPLQYKSNIMENIYKWILLNYWM